MVRIQRVRHLLSVYPFTSSPGTVPGLDISAYCHMPGTVPGLGAYLYTASPVTVRGRDISAYCHGLFYFHGFLGSHICYPGTTTSTSLSFPNDIYPISFNGKDTIPVAKCLFMVQESFIYLSNKFSQPLALSLYIYT